MNCRECNEFLLDYTEGRLPEAERAEFERHLSHCPACVNYMRQYNDTIAMSRAALKAADKNEPIPGELVHAIMAAKRAGQ